MEERLRRLLSNDINYAVNNLSDEIDFFTKFLFGLDCGGCGNRHVEYFIKLYKSGLKTLKQMENRNFELKITERSKTSVVIHIPKEGLVITNANLTDELAIKVLKNYPALISQFKKYPKDWKELIAGKSKGPAGKKTGDVSLDKKNMGALKSIAKDLNIPIGKKSKKELLASIKEAKRVQAEAEKKAVEEKAAKQEAEAKEEEKEKADTEKTPKDEVEDDKEETGKGPDTETDGPKDENPKED